MNKNRITLTPLKAFWEQQTPNKQQGKMVFGGQLKEIRKRNKKKEIETKNEAHPLVGSMTVMAQFHMN